MVQTYVILLEMVEIVDHNYLNDPVLLWPIVA